MLPVFTKIESAFTKDYKQKAVEALKNAQTKLLEEQINRNFSDCMITYYSEVVRQCNHVLSADSTWPGHTTHLAPKDSSAS